MSVIFVRSLQTSNPVYVMVLSNGGAMIWLAMQPLLAAGAEFAWLGQRLSGVVFDSGIFVAMEPAQI
jgi:hypothetical protein